MTGFDILNKHKNISAISKIIDLDNSLDVDFNQIKGFFEEYVEFKNFKIKDLRIHELDK